MIADIYKAGWDFYACKGNVDDYEKVEIPYNDESENPVFDLSVLDEFYEDELEQCNPIEDMFEVVDKALEDAGYSIKDGAEDSSIVCDSKGNLYIVRIMSLPN